MESSPKLTSSSENFIYLELGPEARIRCVEEGLLTSEELAASISRYVAFIEELERKWPMERLKAHLLATLRNKCQWCASKWTTLEIENRDARVRGVSFKERQHYTSKIQTLKKMFADYRAQGIALSKKSPRASQYVTPLDVSVIESKGFEYHLKYLLL